MKRFFSQWMRWIFQLLSHLRFFSVSSFTASRICRSKSSTTWRAKEGVEAGGLRAIG